MIKPEGQPRPLSDREARRVIQDGLGPLFWALKERQQVTCSAAAAAALQSADLTARVISSRTHQAARLICDLLAATQIPAVLLKGMDVANRYYPQPHLRIMGDIDLLVAVDRVQDAVELLKRNGFGNPTEDPDSRWATHHHAVPLWHDEHKVWVELHRRLVTDQSPFREEPLFANEAVWRDPQRGPLADGSAWFLDPQIAYAYTVAHWYYDLMDRWGSPGAQRQIVDLMFLRAGGVQRPAGPVSPGLTRALDLAEGVLSPDEREEPVALPRLVRNRLAALAQFRRPTRDLARDLSGEVFAQYLRGSGAGYNARLAYRSATLAVKSLTRLVAPRAQP